MTVASRADLIIDQGGDFTAQIYWLDENSNPYMIVPPIRMEIRSNENALIDSFVVGVSPDTSSEDLTFNTDNGMIQLYINATRTGKMAPGVYNYDMFTNYTDPNGSVVRTRRLIYGRVEVRKRITNG